VSRAAHEQAPVVQRLRLQYARRGRLRFSSHRDFQRAFERALRRASVPVAYSQGFSPHPKVSYAGAAPTGASTLAEYLELAVSARCDPARVRSALDAALPDGLDVVDVVEVPAGAGPLVERLQASVWEVALPGVEPATAGAAVEAFLGADAVEVERLTRDGVRRLDARGAVAAVSLVDASSGMAEGPCAILRVVVRHGSPTVRPDDVLAGLRRVADLDLPAPSQATRLAQGPLDTETGTVGDPLAPDRDALRALTSAGGADAAVSTPSSDA
jgi:radical SAM-linked protein